MTPWLWAAAAFGHGGPPHSEDLLWNDDGSMVVVSTHGFMYEDGDWDWVCEELFGESLPTDVIQTSDTTFVAGTEGLALSTDGCAWSWHPQFEVDLVWDLATDPSMERRVWLVSDEGLWQSDDAGETFSLIPLPDPEAKLRTVVPMQNGTPTLFGFLDGQAMAWRGSRSTVLDVRSGHLMGLGSDAAGHVYGHFPRASGTDELVRIDPDMNAVSLLETERRITAFLARDEGLMVSVNGDGTYISTDHGDSWTQESTEVYGCLIDGDGYIWACPREASANMWIRTESALTDVPKDWERGPQFSDVSGTRCDDALPECADLWPTVALELGADPFAEIEQPEPVVTENVERSGCKHTSALLLTPWWAWGLRRREKKTRREKHR